MLNFCYTFAVFPRLHSEFKVPCSIFKLQASTRRSRAVGRRGDRRRAFTLIEMLVVMGIIAILMVLVAPAFTTIKSGTDATSAAYTVKGALDAARTYAMANNTYTWVGFAGSIGSPVTGQVALAVVASNDGTNLGTD